MYAKAQQDAAQLGIGLKRMSQVRSALIISALTLVGCGLMPLSNSSIAVIRESKTVTDGKYSIRSFSLAKDDHSG